MDSRYRTKRHANLASQQAARIQRSNTLQRQRMAGALAAMLAFSAAPLAFAGSDDCVESTAATSENRCKKSPIPRIVVTPFFSAGGGNDNGAVNSVAIGTGATTQPAGGLDAGAIAIGWTAGAVGLNDIAIGRGATANAKAAPGRDPKDYALALGYDASALGGGSIAIGHAATASDGKSNENLNATALGNDASASATNSVALGFASSATRENTVSVGGPGNQRQITNVAAGTQDSDAVNVRQIKSSGLIDDAGDNLFAVTYDQNPDGSPNFNRVTFGNGHALGPVLLKNIAPGLDDFDAVDMLQLKAGNLVDADLARRAAVVYDKHADGSPDFTRVTLGHGNGPVMVKNVAAGTEGNDAVNLDQLNAALTGVPTGPDPYFRANGNHDGSDNAAANAPNSVAIGANSIADRADTLSVGDVGKERQIANVAAGSIDTDAVNVAQMKASGLIDATGHSLAAVTYTTTPQGTNYNVVTFGNGRTDGPVSLKNVAPGLDDFDAVDMAQYRASNLIDQENSWRAAVIYDKHADGSPDFNSATLGNGHGPVALKNVAAGQNATDAVNVQQLTDSLAGSGLIDHGGDALEAVVYDAGSQRGRVTLGGMGAAQPVALTNIADGTQTYDAVNFGQLDNLQSQLNIFNTQLGSLDGRVTYLEENPGTGTPPYLDGHGSGNADRNADAGDSAGVALGYNAQATGDNASAVGHNAQALGEYGLATGNDAYAAGDHDTAIGGMARVNAAGSTAIGANSNVGAQATNAVAVGADSTVTAASGTAVGQGASVTATNAVAVGAGSLADRADTVSVGSTGSERQISNVAAGTQRTDAANVGQLQDSVSNVQNWANDRFDNLQQQVDRNRQQANRGIAAASALVNNMPYLPGKLTLNAGVASYRGEGALGIGVSRWSDDGRVNVNAGVSAAANDAPIFRIGVGVVLGD